MFPVDSNVQCEFNGAETKLLKDKWRVIQLTFRLAEDEDQLIFKSIFVPQEGANKFRQRAWHFKKELVEIAQVIGADLSEIPRTNDSNKFADYVAHEFSRMEGASCYIKTVPNGDYTNVSSVRPYISDVPNLEYGVDFRGNSEI